MHLDRLIDGLNLEREFFILGIAPLLTIKVLPLAGKHINFALNCFGKYGELLPSVDAVLRQQLGLFHIAVKLDDLRHIVPPLSR